MIVKTYTRHGLRSAVPSQMDWSTREDQGDGSVPLHELRAERSSTIFMARIQSSSCELNAIAVCAWSPSGASRSAATGLQAEVELLRC